MAKYHRGQIHEALGFRPATEHRRGAWCRHGRRLVSMSEVVCIASCGAGGAVLGPIPRLLAVLTTAPLVSQRLRALIAKRSVEDLAFLAGLVASGKITPLVARQLAGSHIGRPPPSSEVLSFLGFDRTTLSTELQSTLKL